MTLAKLCSVSLLVCLLTPVAWSGDNALTGLLMDQLGVSQEQAEGGAGAIFQFAKSQLGNDDFSKVTDAVPGVTDLLGKAPKSSSSVGGLLGNALGGGELGAVAALAGPFKKLGLKEGMITKYLPIVMTYVKEKGGAVVQKMMGKALGQKTEEPQAEEEAGTAHEAQSPVAAAMQDDAHDQNEATEGEAKKSGLVSKLVDSLGVTEEQAAGGAGALLGYAKSKLSKDDFGKVADAVPGIEGLLGAAPKSDDLGSMLGSALGGGDSGGLGAVAALAGPFKKLGLDEGMVAKYMPIVIAYVKEKGGDVVRDLLAKSFK